MQVQLRNVQPAQAISYLERRLAKPVESFAWQDVWQALHARMFTVAKSAGFDILGDVSGAIDDALKNGTTLEDFQKQLVPLLREKGWWGRADVTDPATGEVVNAQLGSLRRLRTIFDTNLRTSYAAGKWIDAQRVKDDRPYLRYLHTSSEHPRHQHLQFVGVTLPIDHPFWDTHYPPNGWGCKCHVVSMSQRQYDAAAQAGTIRTQAPVVNFRQFVNARTGQTQAVPEGIDPGWGYNVGQALMAVLHAAA